MNKNIDIRTILQKWAEFSEWDPDQKKFNLMSYNYFFHKNNEIVFEFYKKYPQYLTNNAYENNIYYKNFLSTTGKEMKKIEKKLNK